MQLQTLLVIIRAQISTETQSTPWEKKDWFMNIKRSGSHREVKR